MSRLRDESGFTLPELLTAIALFMFIMGATLDTFDGFVTRNRTNTKLNDATDQARTAMDRMAHQLRNLASPTNSNVKSIDKATDYDLVFQTVDPVKRRVRYCLDSTDPSSATLWMQTQAFAVNATDPGLPPTSTCPASGWGGSTQVVTGHVTNRISGDDRNVFYYTGLTGDGDTSKITGIRATLFLDVNPGKPPAEVSIASGDFLRNQNQVPVIPDFSLVQSPVGSHHFIMNASDASDPEGRTLDYFWYTGTGDVASLPSCADDTSQTGGGFSCIGRGLTFDYTFNPTVHGAQNVVLKVVDPGGLSATLTKQTPSLP